MIPKMNCPKTRIIATMFSFKVNDIPFNVPASDFINIFKHSNNAIITDEVTIIKTDEITDMTFAIDSMKPHDSYVIKFMDVLLSLNRPEHIDYHEVRYMLDPKNVDISNKFNSLKSFIADDDKLVFYSCIMKFMKTYCRKTGPLKRCLVALRVLVLCELKHYCMILHWGFQMCYFGTKHILVSKFKQYEQLYFAAITVVLKLAGLNYHMAPEGTERPGQVKVPWSVESKMSHDEIIKVFLGVQVYVASCKAFKLSPEICDILFPFHKDQLFDRTLRAGHLEDYAFDEMVASLMQVNIHYLEPNQIDMMKNRIMNIHYAICKNKHALFVGDNSAKK